MADQKIATLSAEMVLRQEQFLKALGQVEGRLSSVAGTLRGFAGLAATIFVGSSLTRGVEGLVGVSIDLEARLARVGKTTGLTGSELVKLRGQLEGLSTSMGGVKLDELLGIAISGGKLGIASGQIATFARDIGMIRVALEDIPADEAATSIGKILNVFRLGTEDTIKFASALNKLDDSSTATGRELLDLTRRISGPASVLGLSAQKVLALSAALKDAGADTEVAGTAIGQVFGKMATDTEKFADVAGVSLERFAGILRADPLVALQLFERGLGRLDELEQFEVLDSLELRGSRVKMTLLQLNSVLDRIPGYVKLANSEWGSLASILRENEVQGNTTRAQLDRLGNVFQVTAAKIGDFALPVVKALATSFAQLSEDIQKFFSRNSNWFDLIASKLTSGARALGVFLGEWRTFSRLGQVFAAEKFDQFLAVTTRLGKMLRDQLVFGATAAFEVMINLFKAAGTFLGDLFSQVGAQVGAQIQNALAAVTLPGGIKLAKAVPVPGVAPNFAPFDPAHLFGGVGPQPAFDPAGAFANLPNRAGERAALQGQIGEAAAQRDADLARRKEAALPKPAGPPAPPKGPAQLRKEIAAAQRKGRGLVARQKALRNRAALQQRSPVLRRQEAAKIASGFALGAGLAGPGAGAAGAALGAQRMQQSVLGQQVQLSAEITETQKQLANKIQQLEEVLRNVRGNQRGIRRQLAAPGPANLPAGAP